METIRSLRAREILDSRGKPTLEVDLVCSHGIFRASVPSGKSTGEHEAVELRDHEMRYQGNGVQKAVHILTKKVLPKLKGLSVTSQDQIDALLLELDGTDDFSKIGANTALVVSLAAARAGAAASNKALYLYLQQLIKRKAKRYSLASNSFSARIPRCFFNILNGGAHAGNELIFQEFMVSPRAKKMTSQLQIASEVYASLQHLLEQQYGSLATGIGDEGGFAPPLKNPLKALQLLEEAIVCAGYDGVVDIALDAAASEFFDGMRYTFPSKQSLGTRSAASLRAYYLKMIEQFPLISIEDPFDETAFEEFHLLCKELSNPKVQIVADDLTVTNPRRVAIAIASQSANCLLLKLNQVGTLSLALDAALRAKKAGWQIMVSHRSGETTDDFIADLAVALGPCQLKAGAPARGERVAKYNQLLRIEEELSLRTSNSQRRTRKVR